jgi:hypothetical protein
MDLGADLNGVKLKGSNLKNRRQVFRQAIR